MRPAVVAALFAAGASLSGPGPDAPGPNRGEDVRVEAPRSPGASPSVRLSWATHPLTPRSPGSRQRRRRVRAARARGGW